MKALSVASRKYWMPDELCKTCMNCDIPFTFWRRKHHCRFCGKIFCDACSNEKMDGAPFGVDHSLRVCVKCKSFEKSMPGKHGGAAAMGDGGRGHVPHQPAVHAPFVPLFSQPLFTEDHAALFDLESLGSDCLRVGLAAALESPDVVKSLYAAGITEEAQVRAVQKQWEAVLLGLVQTTMSLVDPNCRAGWADKLDFLHYVKIKTVPGGVSKCDWPTGAGPAPPASVLESVLPGDCEFIDGVMFRKSLPHKQMRDNIEHPRVLLLDDALDFDSATELTRLDNLVDQEDQYTKILAKKIVALTPDVVFSTKNTSRSAWETLRTYGNVTLVPNLKPQVINRISRMTGAPVLPSVNHIDKSYDWQMIGKCTKFQTRSLLVAVTETPQVSPTTETGDQPEVARFRDRRNRVTYMVLEGSSTSASSTATPGCTILLRGGVQMLRFTKAILRWVLYCAYNMRLEKCIYYDFGVFPGVPGQPKVTPTSTSTSVPADVPLQVQTSSGEFGDDVSPSCRSTATTRTSVSMKSITILSSSPGIAYQPHGDTASANTINTADLALRSLTSSTPEDSSNISKLLTHTNAIPSVIGLAWTYQSLLVNHVDTVDSTQCKDPALLRIRFYTKGDWSLKHFLESRCFDSAANCAHCKKPQHRHVMSYSHLNGRVEIHVLRKQNAYITDQVVDGDAPTHVDETNIFPLVSSDMAPAAMHAGGHTSSRRFTQHFPVRDVPVPPPCPTPGDRGFGHTMTCTMCTACNRVVAPWRPMSRGSLQFSLGKYLELGFYNADLVSRDPGCSHCPRDHHVRFFGRPSALVAFRYVPLRAHRVLRQGKVKFDKDWAEQCRSEELGKLYVTVSERAVTQITTLGELSKQASRLECEPTFIAALKRLQERVTNLRDQCVEAIRDMCEKVIRGRSVQEAEVDGETERSPANISSRRHSHSTRMPIVGLDVHSFVTSCRQDVLAVGRFQQQWSVLCHALDMDLERFQTGLSKVAQLIRQLPPPTPLPMPLPISVAPAPASAPTPVIGPLASSEPTRMGSGELPVMDNSQSLSVGGHRVEESDSNTPVPLPSEVGAESGVGASATSDGGSTSSRTSSSDEEPDAESLADLLPSPAVRSQASDGQSSVPRLNERRRVSATDALPPEISDPLKLVPPSPPGSHAYFPPGLQSSAVIVHNTILPSAIAYSLSSTLYWRQMGDIMQSAQVRFRDFMDDSGKLDDDAARHSSGSFSSLDTDRGSRAGSDIVVPFQSSVLLDGSEVARHNSDPGIPLNIHGRQRSRSVIVTPSSSRTQMQGDHSWTSAIEERVKASGGHPTPRGPTTTPRGRRRSLGEIDSLIGKAVTQSHHHHGHRPHNHGRDCSAAAGGGECPATTEPASSLLAPATKSKAAAIMEVMDGVRARFEGAKAVAGGTQATPDIKLWGPRAGGGAHRVRSVITTSVTESVPGSTATAASSLFIPIASVVPDVTPDMPGAIPFELSSSAVKPPLKRQESNQHAKSKSDATSRVASGATSPVNGVSGVEPSVWGSDSAFGCALPELDAKSMLISDVQGDIIHTFSDRVAGNEATFVVTSYWAMQFHGLRDLVCDSPRSYVQSLAFCKKWATSGGKSGASFELTEDERFVIKYVKSAELDMFVHNGAKFFAHMHHVLFRGQQSLMARYMGAYKVTVTLANGKKTTSCLVVLENLFYKRNIPDGFKFDLKGKNRSNRAKYMATSTELGGTSGGAGAVPGAVNVQATSGAVLLDDDFLAWTGGYPTVLDEASKLFLNDAVREDTRFLASLKVIDYSLLVAVDESTGEIMMGLIDYVRRYDWMSRMESGVKRSIATSEPTVVHPHRYRDRFCRAMERYFVCVPDKFTQPNALVSNAAETHGDAKPVLDEEALHEDSKEKEETIATTSSS